MFGLGREDDPVFVGSPPWSTTRASERSKVKDDDDFGKASMVDDNDVDDDDISETDADE